MLELRDIRTGCDDIEVLYGVDMHVDEGEIVALVGSNGVGKTTTMRTTCDILSPSHGEIICRDKAIHLKTSYEIVEHDIVQVSENRDLLTNMTVIDNLFPGAQTEEAKAYREENLDEILELFPRLAECKNQRAGTVSGGEQQMPTLARVLTGEPDLLIPDESSIGLVPHFVQEALDIIEGIHVQDMTVLMVEQNVQQALKLADCGYVMENGRISMTVDDGQLLEDEGIVEAYPGV